MGKSNKNKDNTSKSKLIGGKYFPLVSVCTPTYNRRPFIQMMFDCFKNQTYPKECIEWIIVDDGTDKIKDLIENSGISQIKYFEMDKKMPLGEKRNYMHQHVKGSIIVYMDDDDYYPPERISHCVERLNENKNAMVAGSSEIYIYFNHIQKMVQCGPYGPNHATAGTFAFRSELLKQTHYENHAALAEEKAFLKNYTIPMVQLDPMKTILVFSHNHNTFDKKKLLNNMHPDYCKYSPKTVDDFIKNPFENSIKKFFQEDIDHLLAKYPPGEPNMKPDVLENMKLIEKERENIIANNNAPKIILSKPGEPPVELSHEQIINIIQQQQQQLQSMATRITDQNQTIEKLQKMIFENNIKSSMSKTIKPEKPISKTQPIGDFNIAD
jgi:glycosyltransferase involved in cell wall biosynthesis